MTATANKQQLSIKVVQDEFDEDVHELWSTVTDLYSKTWPYRLGSIRDGYDAAHIVHVVNTHEALVQALEAAHAWIERERKHMNEYAWQADTYTKVTAALAKAKG